MKSRVFSKGRKIAIAVCMVLAVATGGMSVAYPHVKQAYAEGETVADELTQEFSSISVAYAPSVTSIEKGLDAFNSTFENGAFTVDRTDVLNRLKDKLIVTTNGGETTTGDYNVLSVNYTPAATEGAKATATVTVQAKATADAVGAQDGYLTATTPSIQVDGRIQSVDVAINGATVGKNDSGVYKVKDETGALTLASAFIADTSVCPIESLKKYLTVTLTYPSLGSFTAKASDYKIDETSFAIGNRTITVSVEYSNGTEAETEVTEPVLFERVKVVGLEVTKTSNTVYSQTNVTDVIQVDATYNYIDRNTNKPFVKKNISDREYEVVGSLVPTATDITKITPTPYSPNRELTVNNGSGSRVEQRNSDTHNLPGVFGTDKNDTKYSYPKEIKIKSGEAEPASVNFTVTMTNPYQLVGITTNGFPEQYIGEQLDLTGIMLNMSYVGLTTDSSGNVIGDFNDVPQSFGSVGASKIARTDIGSMQSLSIDLNDYKDCVYVHFNTSDYSQDPNNANYWKSYENATVPQNETQVQLRFVYGGQMFYRANGASGGAWDWSTIWQSNSNQVDASFRFTSSQSTTEDNIDYYTLPIIDTSTQGYRQGMTKTIAGADLTQEKSATAPNGIPNGMQIVIGNGTKELTYTFNFGVNGLDVTNITDTEISSDIGLRLVEQSDGYVLQVLKPGKYSVQFKTGDATKQHWVGQTAGEFSYSFTVRKGQLTAMYAGTTLEANGNLSSMRNETGDVLLNRLTVLLYADSTLVSGQTGAPASYTVWLSKIYDVNGMPIQFTPAALFTVTGNQRNVLVNTVNTDPTWRAIQENDKAGTKFLLSIAYDGTEFYSESAPDHVTEKNMATLVVAAPDPNDLDLSPIPYYTNGAVLTAGELETRWTNIYGNEYDISIEENSTELASTAVLHVKNTYYLVFKTKGENPEEVARKEIEILPAAFFDQRTTSDVSVEYSKLTGDTFDTLHSAAVTAANAYPYAVKASTTPLGYTNADNRYVTLASDLTAGAWYAVYQTEYAENDGPSEDGAGNADYNLPNIYVAFTVTTCKVSLTVEAEGFTKTPAGNYEAVYNATAKTFVISGLVNAFSPSVTAKFIGSETNILASYYTTANENGEYTLTATLAGTYVITITNTYPDGITLAEDSASTYTIVINKAPVTIETTETAEGTVLVEKLGSSLDLKNIAIKGNGDAAEQGLTISSYTLNDGITPEDVVMGQVYTLTVTAISGNNLQGGITYAVNYSLPENAAVEITITKATLPVLTSRPNSPLTSGTDTDDAKVFNLTVGSANNITLTTILSYFSNVNNSDDVYIFSVERIAARAADPALLEQLRNGTLPEGDYKLTIQPNATSAWGEGGKNVVVNLSIVSYAAEGSYFFGGYLNGTYDAITNDDIAGLFENSVDDTVHLTNATYDYITRDGYKTFNAEAAKSLTAGTYTIRITTTDSKVINAQLTVVRAPITVKITAEIEYGATSLADGNPQISVDSNIDAYKGMLLASNLFALSDRSLNASETAYKGGSYFALNTTTLSNYNVTFSNESTLKVTKAEVTVKPNFTFIYAEGLIATYRLGANQLKFDPELLINDVTGALQFTVTKVGNVFTITHDAAQDNLSSRNYSFAIDEEAFSGANVVEFTVQAKQNLTYEGYALDLVDTTGVPAGVTVFYSVDNGNVWSTAAQGVNAKNYNVQYRIDIKDFGTVAAKTDGVSVTISSNKNILSSDFQLNNDSIIKKEDGVTEGNISKDAWTYGNFNGYVKTLPEAKFHGNIDYSLTGPGLERAITGNNLIVLLNANANGLPVGVYTLTATTSAGTALGDTQDEIFTNYTSQTITYYFRVGKAPLTIKANTQTVTHKGAIDVDTVFSFDKTITVSGWNNAVGDSNALLSGLAEKINFSCGEYSNQSDAGTYTNAITLAWKDGNNQFTLDNYEIFLEDGDLIVEKFAFTIQINSITVPYLGAIPAYTAVVAGNRNFNYGEIVRLIAEGLPTDNSTPGVNLYPIYAVYVNEDVKKNYDVTVVGDYDPTKEGAIALPESAISATAGTLNITPAFVSINWDGKDQAFVYNGQQISGITANAISYAMPDGSSVEFKDSDKKPTFKYRFQEVISNTTDSETTTEFGDYSEYGEFPVNAGTYAIHAESVNDNFTTGGAYIVIFIEKATISLSVKTHTIQYRDSITSITDENIADRFAYQGVLPDDEDLLKLALTTGTIYTVQKSDGTTQPFNSINQLPRGNYILQATILENAEIRNNYNIQVTNGTLTITQRTVTIELRDETIEYTGLTYNQTELGLLKYEIKYSENVIEEETADALGITLWIAENAKDVGEYTLRAHAANNGNYLVSFSTTGTVVDGEKKFTITPKHIKVTPVINVTYGSKNYTVSYLFKHLERDAAGTESWVDGLANNEDINVLTRQLDAEGKPYVSGGFTYSVSFTVGGSNNLGYSATRTTANLVFKNYTFELATDVNELQWAIKELEVAPSLVANFATYTGEAITPEFNFENLPADLKNEFAQALILTDENGDDLNIENASSKPYTVKLGIDKDYAKKYKFIDNPEEGFKFTINPKTINLSWQIPQMTLGEQSMNVLENYDETVANLISLQGDGVHSGFYRVFSAYSYDPNNPNDEGTATTQWRDVPFPTEFVEDKCQIHITDAGHYYIRFRINADSSTNYSFGANEDGSFKTEIVLDFTVISSAISMDITMENNGVKPYDGTAAKYTAQIQADYMQPGWAEATNFTRYDAAISKEEYDAIVDGTQQIEKLTNLTYTTAAPVNVGYYVARIIYFRDTASGAIGAEKYVVYAITPQTMTVAPEAQGTLSFEYNKTLRSFTVKVTDAYAVDLYSVHPEYIYVTANDERVETDITVEEHNGVLTVTFYVANAGRYALNFSVPENGNYVWLIRSSSSEDGTETVVGSESDVYSCSGFSVTQAVITISEETEATILPVEYGESEQYRRTVIEMLMSRIPEAAREFVDMDTDIYSILYFIGEGDDRVNVTPSTIGDYAFNVAFDVTGVNHNNYRFEGSLVGTLRIIRKTVYVKASVSQIYGQPIGNRTFTFEFDGFIGNDNASGVLSIDYTQFSPMVPNLLPVGRHSGVITAEEDETTHGIKGFGPRTVGGVTLEDNYRYVLDVENSSVIVTPLSITVTLGNVNVPYGADIIMDGITATPSGNTIPEQYSDLLSLLNVFLSVDVVKTDTFSPNAGSYPIHARSENPNYNVTFVGGIFTITPISVTITINMENGVYGTRLAPASLGRVTSTENATLEVGVIARSLVYLYTGTTESGEEYESSSVPTEAGTYTVTASINPSRAGNYSLIGTTSKVFSIAKKTVDVSGITIEDRVYNHGASITPVITDATSGNAQYYNYTLGTYTEAGTYNIELTLKDTDNTQWPNNAQSYTVTFTILKAQNSGEIAMNGWTYGSAANQPTVSILHGEPSDFNYAIEYSSDGGTTWTTTVPTNAGAYNVRVAFAQSKNYNAFSAVAPFSIAKRKIDVPTLGIFADGNNKNDTYSGKVLTVFVNDYDAATMLIGTPNPDEDKTDGRLAISGNAVTITATNAGTYSVILSLLNTNNYAWNGTDATEVTLEWTVKPYVVKAPTQNNNQFVVTGDILEYLPEGFDPTIMEITGNERGYAGESNVTISLKDKANYVWATDDPANLTSDITFTWKIEGVGGVFVGIVSALSVVAAAAVAMIAVQIVMNNNRKKREAAEMAARDAAVSGDAEGAEISDNEGQGE